MNNEHKTNGQASTRQRFGIITAASAALIMTIATAAGPLAATERHSDWQDADAGSLGLNPSSDLAWCAADAGSLGIPDPVAACSG